MGEWERSSKTYFADKLDFVAFNIFDGEDVKFCEKVKTQVVHGISEDRFLNE